MAERRPMTADDLFTETGDPDVWGLPSRALDTELLTRLIDGSETSVADLDAAIVLVDQVQNDLIAEGTDGNRTLSDAEIALAIRALRAVTARLDMEVRLPFRDYKTFRQYWIANGAKGSWQARREMVHGFLDEPTAHLHERKEGLPPASIQNIALDSLQSPEAILEHLRRLNTHIESDPRLAVSVAKDLVESTARLVLRQRQQPFDAKEDVPALAYRAQLRLGLHRKALHPEATPDSLHKILGALSTLVQGLTELRNDVGVGHGRESVPTWVRPRHARLAASVATTWCALLLETLGDPSAPWKSNDAAD